MSVTRLVISYDGAPFAGWATQPGQRSVQAEIEKALKVILKSEVSLTVGGRTDRGVHALAQVASYPGEPVKLKSINALIPQEIAVSAVDAMHETFDARHDATSRAYRYQIYRGGTRSPFHAGRALWHSWPLDIEVLKNCAEALVGVHNFAAFTPSESYDRRFEREIKVARWLSRGGILSFEIEGDSFLRHMNRILIGTMLEVAAGRRSFDEFVELLDGRPRANGGKTAPAHGLYLVGIGYGASVLAV